VTLRGNLEGTEAVPNKKPHQPKRPTDDDASQAPNVRLDKAGQVAVTYSDKPAKGPPDKQIHPRRRLDDVPDAAGGRNRK
jgi:hypothetical protein